MDFNAILKKSLAIVDEEYQNALTGFQKIVGEMNSAIKANVAEEMSLEILEVATNIDGAVYRLILDFDENDGAAKIVALGMFKIPQTGFPIHVGTYTKSTNEFSTSTLLLDNKGIEEYFGEIFINPESNLMQAIGYGIRIKNKAKIS